MQLKAIAERIGEWASLLRRIPWVELLVRSDSGALVRRLAQEIEQRYGIARS
jgi:hypothetical protein